MQNVYHQSQKKSAAVGRGLAELLRSSKLSVMELVTAVSAADAVFFSVAVRTNFGVRVGVLAILPGEGV